MKTAKKAILLVLCAALLVTASVMGTLAYLTSTSDTVTNTMTVGKVEITLDEAKVNEYGEMLYKTSVEGEYTTTGTDLADRVTSNEYKLIPGRTYTKDPIVTVKADSEACYVFVKVVNGISGIDGGKMTKEDTDGENTVYSIEEQIRNNGWAVLDATNFPGVYYQKIHSATTADVSLSVFENFKIASGADESSEWTKTDLKIEITAYAIQADGFTDANAAWTASGFGDATTTDGN